ncbi:MAG TPA: hypothetical protein VEF03_00500 [Candidatus Binataceae bacterium]|nr:hypothetical protein [Candidatus Binataceae bacterium]
MFTDFIRMQLLTPARVGGIVTHLPQFARVFYRLMVDGRVSIFAKLAPLLIILLMFTPPAIELDFVPIVGEVDWILALYFALRLFLWLCPAEVVREHVDRIARGQ